MLITSFSPAGESHWRIVVLYTNKGPLRKLGCQGLQGNPIWSRDDIGNVDSPIFSLRILTLETVFGSHGHILDGLQKLTVIKKSTEK